ncbi:MAG: ATP-binding cassette domain-containing protein [Nitrospiraceae bacterium]|nr:ATP-binding cassette domain-containing protein [Nitrospiraceae bacterium]
MLLETKGLGFKDILKDISFSLNEGRIIGIVGKNGAGKTTLLRCIAGFYDFSGDVFIEGKSIKTISIGKRARLINYMPSNLNLSFPYTVSEFLSISTLMFKVDCERIADTMKKLRIYSLRHRKVYSLSAGEVSRILIARMLLIDPNICLFDEPSAFLDVENLQFFASILKKLRKKGKLIILTAHNLNFLIDISDGFLALKNGKLIFNGNKLPLIKNLTEIFDANLSICESKGDLYIKPSIGGFA